MPNTTSVPPVTFGTKGFIAPDESLILDGIQADLNAAFGGNLNPGLETPQGQIASSMAALLGNSNDIFVKLTQQVDPSYAEGRMQDGIARIYFIERKPAQSTVVACTVTGLPGVVIPDGSLAVATDENLYMSTGSTTIPAGGSISIEFAAVVPGPIACPTNTLNTIYKAISGWDSVNNPADGVIGNDVESRADFEFRRNQSVFLNSRGLLPSVLAAVLQIPGVLDAYATENDTGGTLSIGTVNLVAHSMYVAVSGGDPDAIAQAIWSKKSPGCAYNGNTTRTVYDNNSGYSLPYPSYAVTFEIPNALPILFAVNIANNSKVPANASDLIKAAIISAFAGADGGVRPRIGSTIYASRFYAPVAALGSWVEIISLQIGTVTANQNSVSVSIAEVPVVSDTDITVTLT